MCLQMYVSSLIFCGDEMLGFSVPFAGPLDTKGYKGIG